MLYSQLNPHLPMQPDDVAIKSLAKLLTITDNRCWLCGSPANGGFTQIWPWMKNKRHNKIPACSSCTRTKRKMTLENYRATFPPGFQFWGEHQNLWLPLAQHYKKAF